MYDSEVLSLVQSTHEQLGAEATVKTYWRASVCPGRRASSPAMEAEAELNETKQNARHLEGEEGQSMCMLTGMVPGAWR